MTELKIPDHIAIILDGNGRWAKKQNRPRTFGHKEGAENVIRIAKSCKKFGVKTLTLYAFSTENWKRPATEVGFLMDLLIKFVNSKLEQLMAEDCKINFLGDISKLPAKTKDACDLALDKTKDNKSLVINIALNYGGRDEIVHAFKEIMEKGYVPDEITEELISENLYTAGLPDPDLLIRPGGEIRLSNFLIYQLAYTELYFTDVLWPDFTEDDLREAILAFTKRDRRYGGL
ncbi:isoprenyl transferase [Anaerococcus murdochii]|uniref:Isoprenyl transferase n=1 Tax=Anaerococcus murdochii TaxID=411577 RepID=A0ABS7SWE3_9FIRM|nr:isoprenyl transferase [Anaerococcus murdochii]MBZ2385854.1 isoprenyl transferase [Anaerococcus murdochii]